MSLKKNTLVRKIAKAIASLCVKSKIVTRLFRAVNFKGKGYITNFMQLKSDEPIVADCGGIAFKIDFKDDIQKQIYFNSYELRNLNPVVKLVNPEWTCFDAGANVGAYTLQFAKRMGSTGRVYAFEPEPRNYARLNENCKLNDFANIVKTYETALTNFDGKAEFFLADRNQSGWHSLTEFKDIVKSKIEVRTMKLDTFVRDEAIKKIDLIKIDVEGNEFDVLEGASECLENRIFKYIFIEFNGPRLAEKGKTFTQFMEVFSRNHYEPVKLNLKLLNEIARHKLNPEEICENFLFYKTIAKDDI